MSLEPWLVEQLDLLRGEGLLRDPSQEAWASGLTSGWLNACSNDYLGLAHERVSRETSLALGAQRRGGGASRLIYGGSPSHLALESALAAWVRLPAALLFPSGYAANLGTLAALADRDTLVVSDALNHASIIDGCRLAGARTVVVPHLALDAMERALQTPAARKLLVVESYYSMDGDGPPLPALRALCDRHDASLVVDDAHALGTYGPNGAGRCAQAGVRPDVLVGTLGKAVGVQGAFVAGSPALRTWLWNRARSFVFSTATPPWHALLTLEAVQRVQRAEAERQRLIDYARQLRAALPDPWRSRDRSEGPILPLHLGDNERALAAAGRLAAERILVQPIRYPTVPQGTARLRVTLRADFSPDEVQHLSQHLHRALLAVGPP